jgi:hypothetical protein
VYPPVFELSTLRLEYGLTALPLQLPALPSVAKSCLNRAVSGFLNAANKPLKFNVKSLLMYVS